MACKTSILLHGDSGEGKTVLAGAIAEYVYKTTGMITRLATADQGGWENLSLQVEDKIIDPWAVGDYKNPFETLTLAAQGYWPNKNGGLEYTPPPQLNPKVGCYIFESLVNYSGLLMDELGDAAAAGKLMGGQGAPMAFQSGAMKVVASAPSNFMIVQQRMKKIVTASQLLDGCVVIWTSRTMKTVDEGKSDPCYGPMLVGKAMTPDIPGWFIHTLHLDSVDTVDPKTKVKGVERRIYLRKHYGVNNPTVPFVANLRVPPEVEHKKPEYLVSDMLNGSPAADLFGLLDKLKADAREVRNAKKPSVTHPNGLL
jgi:hypothetical protein